MKNKLMAHVIAGYPTTAECVELMLGMQKLGVYAIEVQIPFSDPVADGPTIMQANDIALNQEVKVFQCFGMIKLARSKGLTCPVYLMSYVNKLLSFGFANFCKQAKKSSVSGFILPDLPFDTVEYNQLRHLCAKFKLDIVPVLSPNMATRRLKQLIIESNGLLYVTSTKGITGDKIAISPELLKLIEKIRLLSKASIAVGFGISKQEHVNSVLEFADIAVVGSETIRVTEQKGIDGAIKFVEGLMGH